MSSPFRRSLLRNSSNSPDQRRRSQLQRNGQHRPSSRDSTSSPSRRLAEEFSRVIIADSEAFTQSIDAQVDEQERTHREALRKSLAEHEAVRRSADLARELVETQIQRERKRREQDAQLKVEEARRQAEQEELDRRKKEADRLRRAEEERVTKQRQEEEIRKQAQAQQARQDAERKQQEEAKRLKEQQDAERRAKAAADQQAREEAERNAAKQKQVTADAQIPAHQSTTNGVAPTAPEGIASTQQQRDIEHERYLAMHKRLKEMRQWVMSESAKHQGMKERLGEMRRTIKKSLSIFNFVDKTKNTKPTTDIRTLLEEATKMHQIMLDPTPFIVALQGDSSTGQYPGALLLLLNYLAKYTIQQFADQGSREAKTAEPFAIMLALMFCNAAFQYNGHSLIDVLWAKYHKVCPVLFGINGDPKTARGRHRLGWKFEKDTASNDPAKGSFVLADEHLSNQAGLAAGFSAVTLRNFSKSKSRNPAPNRLYWRAFARVASTPPAERTATHYVVMRNMLEHSIQRFIEFYGATAIAAIRTVLKQWPQQAANKTDPNVLALDGMSQFLEKDHGLCL